jgi:hypothetical protein
MSASRRTRTLRIPRPVSRALLALRPPRGPRVSGRRHGDESGTAATALMGAVRRQVLILRAQRIVADEIRRVLCPAAGATPPTPRAFWAMRARRRPPDSADADRETPQERLIALCDVSFALQACLRSSEAVLADVAQDDAVVRLLKHVPGFGVSLALLVRYEVGDIRRFRTAAQFIRHAGFAQAMHTPWASWQQSSEPQNLWLRRAFVEAASSAVHQSAALRAHYEQLRARHGHRSAIIATARKLARLVWLIWGQDRSRVEYQAAAVSALPTGAGPSSSGPARRDEAHTRRARRRGHRTRRDRASRNRPCRRAPRHCTRDRDRTRSGRERTGPP